MDLQLAGRRALVTGSSSGIGAGVARMLAEEGCRVVVHGRDRSRAEGVAQQCGAVGIALGDLSTDAGADAVVAAAKAVVSGGIDILVNNAGGGGHTAIQRWLDVLEADWDATYQVNTIAAVRMIRRLAPGMAENHWGRIIQIGSAIASQPGVLGPDYASAKAGMQSMTVGLAKALANTGITVNTVSPGVIATGTLLAFARGIAPRENWGEGLDDTELGVRMGRDRHKLPVGRIGTVEDVGHAVCMLASPKGGYITGANIRVDGGQLLGVN